MTDYQVSGFDSTKPGSIQITVTYQGKTASVSLTVKEKSAVEAKDIRQVKPSVKVTGSSYSTVQIGWRKVEGAEGYQIYRAVSKNGTYRKVKTVKGGNTLSFTDQKKKFNKTYYYKVRAYRTEKGKGSNKQIFKYTGREGETGETSCDASEKNNHRNVCYLEESSRCLRIPGALFSEKEVRL